MVAGTPSDRGADRFVVDLAALGCNPVRRGDVVVYRLRPVSGTYAGESIETAVKVAEVLGWPAVPPHWIHLPDHISFAKTNSDTQGCEPGWRRHSRNPEPWKLDREPIVLWIAHVRGVIGQAI